VVALQIDLSRPDIDEFERQAGGHQGLGQDSKQSCTSGRHTGISTALHDGGGIPYRDRSWRFILRLTLLIALVIASATSAAAQDRPFLFSVSIAPQTKQAVRFDYDVGIGERAFQSDTADQPEQRIGVQASYGRLTLLGRVGIAEGSGSSYQSSQSGEALYSMLGPASPVTLAAGGGVLHEAGGVNVLLARVVAARDTNTSWLHGDMLFQKPLAAGRDAVDLITSVGWARKVTSGVSLGVEAIGEDLEGFWDSQEAEGGARLLAGPSLHVAPPGKRWQLIATGGPLFHPSDSGRSSDAIRDLPPDTRRASYAFKASLSIDLVSAR
jgi:hypothetical protein